jgi:hypothetical protein
MQRVVNEYFDSSKEMRRMPSERIALAGLVVMRRAGP